MACLRPQLWLVGRDQTLATLATPKEDRGALELDVRQAEALGKARARATAQAKMKKVSLRQALQVSQAKASTPNKVPQS